MTNTQHVIICLLRSMVLFSFHCVFSAVWCYFHSTVSSPQYGVIFIPLCFNLSMFLNLATHPVQIVWNFGSGEERSPSSLSHMGVECGWSGHVTIGCYVAAPMG